MRKIIGCIWLVINSIILSFILFRLFPYPGPSALLQYPLAVIFSGAIAVLAYYLISITEKTWLKYSIYISLLVFVNYFTVRIYPEERPITQIKNAYHIYRNQDSIEFEDMFGENFQVNSTRVTAALSKYRKRVPDEAYRITYRTNYNSYYYIARYGDQYVSNNTALQIVMNDSNNVVVFTDTGSLEKYEFKAPDDLFYSSDENDNHGANGIFFDKCILKPVGGFNQWFYNQIEAL